VNHQDFAIVYFLTELERCCHNCIVKCVKIVIIVIATFKWWWYK